MDSFFIWHKWSLSIEGVTFFSESENLNFWQIFEIFRPFGFFPYSAQMITSKRRCVAYNDLWPWPISSRSFGLGLENRVRSVASTVLDGFFPYLIQMITIIRGCVACNILQNLKIWIFGKFLKFFRLDLEKKDLQFSMDYFHICHKSSLALEGVSHVMTFDLDLYLQGHMTLALKIMSAL